MKKILLGLLGLFFWNCSNENDSQKTNSQSEILVKK